MTGSQLTRLEVLLTRGTLQRKEKADKTELVFTFPRDPDEPAEHLQIAKEMEGILNLVKIEKRREISQNKKHAQQLRRYREKLLRQKELSRLRDKFKGVKRRARKEGKR